MNPVTPMTYRIDRQTVLRRKPSARPQARETRIPTSLVALLIWTYQRQRADLMSGKGLFGPERNVVVPESEPDHQWSGCGCALLEAVHQLGVRIEPAGWQRPAVHADADLVHDLVVEISRADWLGAMLLRRQARLGAPPEWGEGRQRFEPLRDARDRVVQDRYDEVVVLDDNHGVRAVPVRYCPVVAYPSDAWVEMTRGEYRAWHRALVALERALAALPRERGLMRYRIAELGAMAEPWNAVGNEIR